MDSHTQLSEISQAASFNLIALFVRNVRGAALRFAKLIKKVISARPLPSGGLLRDEPGRGPSLREGCLKRLAPNTNHNQNPNPHDIALSRATLLPNVPSEKRRGPSLREGCFSRLSPTPVGRPF